MVLITPQSYKFSKILEFAFEIPPTIVINCTGHSTYQSMKPYIEVADEIQKAELAKWDKVEMQGDIKSDMAKKLGNVNETTLI